jgi:DNA-binding beta-propeller fold protein YncE
LQPPRPPFLPPPPWRDARITTIAGSGRPGYAGDAGPAQTALLRQPFFVAFDRSGRLLIAEDENAVVRAVDRRGRIATFAGQGALKGDAGDGGLAKAATFIAPVSLAVDRDETLYVVDRAARKIRRVDGRTDVITTLGGTGANGNAGDGGPASAAQFREPHDAALDGRGGLLIADVSDNRVRRVDLRTGIITTWGGTGRGAREGDNGPLALASFAGPRAIAVDARDGTIYVCEREGNTVRRVDGRTNTVTTFAGTGAKGYEGDGGPATHATFNGPKGVFCDTRTGDLFVVDTENHAIRHISALDRHRIHGRGRRTRQPRGQRAGNPSRPRPAARRRSGPQKRRPSDRRLEQSPHPPRRPSSAILTLHRANDKITRITAG